MKVYMSPFAHLLPTGKKLRMTCEAAAYFLASTAFMKARHEKSGPRTTHSINSYHTLWEVRSFPRQWELQNGFRKVHTRGQMQKWRGKCRFFPTISSFWHIWWDIHFLHEHTNWTPCTRATRYIWLRNTDCSILLTNNFQRLFFVVVLPKLALSCKCPRIRLQNNIP